MINHICMVCNGYNSGINQVVRLRDDKETYDIEGHISCTDEIWLRLKKVKNVDKLSVQKVLKEINYNKEMD